MTYNCLKIDFPNGQASFIETILGHSSDLLMLTHESLIELNRFPSNAFNKDYY